MNSNAIVSSLLQLDVARGDMNSNAIVSSLLQLDLAGQPRGVDNLSCQVQHVGLVLVCLRQGVEGILLQDHMAGAAGTLAAAGALDFYVVLVRDLQDRLPRL